MLSVCLATYNGSRFIREQVESILPQLGPADELVVSDDHSRDDTLQVIRSFSDPRIKITENKSRKGAIGNFENALRLAKGDVLVLSDQDDVWLPGKLEVVREQMSGKESSPHLIVMDYQVVDFDDKVLVDSFFRYRKAGKGLLKNIYDNTYVGCNSAFNRKLLEIALPFPDRIPMHDMWLGLLAELFGETQFVPRTTMKYRRHDKNVTPFRRELRPLLQIRRRVNLVFALLKRYQEIKRKQSC